VNGYVWPGIYGFPTLSVGSDGPDTASTFTFTDGGTFSFVSLDLDNPGVSGPPVTVQGYEGATLVASDIFDVPTVAGTPATFDVVHLAGLDLTSLVVTVTSNELDTPLVDNVTFNAATPEPGMIPLLGLSICGILGLRWKRRNANLKSSDFEHRNITKRRELLRSAV
jgi:hypothetical protein